MTFNIDKAEYGSYELEITIDRPRASVWTALTQETNAWWLPSFHMVSEASVVTFRAEAGGHLLEKCESGGSLLWYTVHMVDPGNSIHLVGHSFPEWGGPCTSMLKLAIEDCEIGCKLVVSDSYFGRVQQSHVESLRDGWTELFTNGLKDYCERA